MASARDRLPPGQRRVEKWPVLDLGVRPKLDTATWSLQIDGLVAVPQRWDWETFRALPTVEMVSDIHCVTAWSRFDNCWQGVAAAEIVTRVEPHADARFVHFHAHDGYTTNVSLDRFGAPDALLAWGWSGEPISPAHGGPVRVVIPSLYFWKSAKWVRRITFAGEDRPGYWETRGYHNDADPWKEERFS